MKHKVVLLACIFALVSVVSLFATRIEGGVAFTSKPIIDPVPAYGTETDMNTSVYGHLQHGFLDMEMYAGADLLSRENSQFKSTDFMGYDLRGFWAVPMIGIGHDFDELFDDFTLRLATTVGPDFRIKGGMVMDKANFKKMLASSKLHYQLQANLYFKKLPFAINAFMICESKGSTENIIDFKHWDKLAFSDRTLFGVSFTIALQSQNESSTSKTDSEYVIIQPARYNNSSCE